MNHLELHTDRLRLRRWTPADRPLFADMNADLQVMEHHPAALTRDESDALADRIQDHFDEHGFGLWAVEIPGLAPFAGFLGLSIPRFEARFTPCVEIGWRLARDQWGCGYATEGARAALAFGFESLRLDEIVSFTVPANTRSRRVMEKIGMTRSPLEDFEHPSLPEAHPLRRHVLYRISRPPALRAWFAAMALLCLVPACATTRFNPFEGPQPTAVFIESNPWEMVIGSDTPRVAVYGNGEVIFAKIVNDELVYHHVRLASEALAEVQGRFSRVLTGKDLKSEYAIDPNVTDQPEALFYFREGERETVATVYGLAASGTEQTPNTRIAGDPDAVAPPGELLDLHRWLCRLDFPEARVWTPRYVEVMLWDSSQESEPSIRWPEDWPALDSHRAFRRGEDYSIFLDGSLLPRLLELLSSQHEKGAVELGGKKWAVAYRFTFPGEPLWRRSLEMD